MGRLYIREKYLGIKRNAHELPWDILAFLSKKFKSLRKGLVNPSSITGTVKEKDRGEGEFRTFRAGSCLSLFTVPFAMISLISSLRIFCFSRRLSSRSFCIISLCCLAKRVIFAFAFIALSKNSFFWRSRRSISAFGGASSQKRLLRKYYSQCSDKSEITQRKSRNTQNRQRRMISKHWE
jgi:hypothetical protein